MKNHEYILSRLIGTPVLMDAGKWEIISENISLRLATGKALDTGVAVPTEKNIETSVPKSLAIIRVFDSLVSKGGAGESGFTSYQSILSQIKFAADNGVTKIGFYIDSPGGEALGNFPLTSYIASLPKEKGIQTFSFTDGMMTSAAYAIASATQKIYAVPTSKIGSIGTILTLLDKTKANEDAGITYEVMRSKSEKALYNPNEPITDKVKEKALQDLMALDTAFNEEVNRNRPQLSIQKIVDMKGNSYMGQEALQLGLIDKLVSNFDEVLSLETKKNVNNSNRGNHMNLEEYQTQNAELKNEISQLKAAGVSAISNAVKGERERCLNIIEAGVKFKVKSENIVRAIDKGKDKEDAIEQFEALAEARGNATMIDTFGSSNAIVTPSIPNKPVSSIEELPTSKYFDMLAAAFAGEDLTKFGVK